MKLQDLQNPIVLLTAGAVLTMFGLFSYAAYFYFYAISDAQSRLGFLGSILGGSIGGIMTLIAAVIAWIAVHKQIKANTDLIKEERHGRQISINKRIVASVERVKSDFRAEKKEFDTVPYYDDYTKFKEIFDINIIYTGNDTWLVDEKSAKLVDKINSVINNHNRNYAGKIINKNRSLMPNDYFKNALRNCDDLLKIYRENQ